MISYCVRDELRNQRTWKYCKVDKGLDTRMQCGGKGTYKITHAMWIHKALDAEREKAQR